VSAGFQESIASSQLSAAASETRSTVSKAVKRTSDSRRAAAKILLSSETKETKRLTTAELQRLVLLEQLRYIRAKQRLLGRKELKPSAAATAAAADADDNFYDCLEHDVFYAL
jgi:hypothetical protein